MGRTHGGARGPRVPCAEFYRLREELVERLSRDVYVASGQAPTTAHTLARVAKQVPAGVFCLLTALRIHDLTTQSPAEVWIALPEKARKPASTCPRLRVARFSGAALTSGIETHRIEGVDIHVDSAAKTAGFLQLFDVPWSGPERHFEDS